MIVVEGPDGSGKTTLVRQLVQLLEVELVPKAVSSEMQGMVDLPTYIEEQLLRGFGPRLYDRFALVSGPIYGPLFGMKPPNDIFKSLVRAASWQRTLSLLNPITIYCLPHHETVELNLASSDDATNSALLEQFMQAYWSYSMTAAHHLSHSERIFIYDYEFNKPLDVARWIRNEFSEGGFAPPEFREESRI